MNLLSARFLLSGCVALAIGMGTVRAETSTEAVDRIWNAFINSKTNDDLASSVFLDLSKRIAHEQGIAVIAPIMTRSKDWKGEEVLIFVSLVCYLPPEKSIPILKQYQKDGKPWERQCATDLLIEINNYLESQKTVNVNVTIPGR